MTCWAFCQFWKLVSKTRILTFLIWLCVMIYRLQLILYTSKFNFKDVFLVYTKKICWISQCEIKNANIHSGLWRRVTFCCCTINVVVLRETLVLEVQHVGLKKCTVCTLMKMLTFLDGPVDRYSKRWRLRCE